ncbi:MAG TPA: zinc ribbon domain-containing protein [Solirubrobacteraceae bacterium]|jgi:predicted nucleic acid-binding Zn ribbon protein|nr:zinc ribbon domain-containing protein [Solirubrobacteraceae bacterium]
MPIYEYRRPDGTTFEIQQSFSEDALTVDPDTGVPVERVLHPPAVHFKGKGFYNTDYGTRKRQRETLAAAEGSSSKDSSSAKDSSSKDGSSSGSGEGSGGSSSSSSGEGAKADKSSSKQSGGSKDAKPAAAKKT